MAHVLLMAIAGFLQNNMQSKAIPVLRYRFALRSPILASINEQVAMKHLEHRLTLTDTWDNFASRITSVLMSFCMLFMDENREKTPNLPQFNLHTK